MWFDPLLIIELDEGIMSVIPITDEGFYDALVEIMHFFFFMEENEKPKKPVIDPHEFDWI